MSAQRIKTPQEVMKQIAIWKSAHPEETHQELATRFALPEHKIRYALEKFSQSADLMQNTKSGRNTASRYIAGKGDDIELLKGQLQICIAALETDKKMAVSTRLELLYKAMKIKAFLQDVEISRHIKSVDAKILMRIVKRFWPEATPADVAKLYQEELLKCKTELA